MDENKRLMMLVALGIIFTLATFALVLVDLVKPDAAYDEGYMASTERSYEWMAGWSRDCQSQGKIFTVEASGEKSVKNVRCATEQKEEKLLK